MPRADKRYLIQVVESGTRVLEFVANRPECTQSDIAAGLGLTATQVFRTLHTLEALGYVTRNPARTYLLGHKCLFLGYAASRRHPLIRTASAPMDELEAATGEGVHLVVRDGLERVIVGLRESAHAVRVSTPIGTKNPLYYGGTGLAILAFSPPDVVDAVLSGDMSARTALTLTEPKRLLELLARIRQDGVHTARGDFSDGAFSIAAPIFEAGGTVNAAICVAGPELRLDPDREARYRELVRDAARRISVDLGHTAP